MVKALAIFNSLIGVICMTFYALQMQASALTPDSQGMVLLGIGGAALAAAGMGLNRIGILFHGFALSLFASIALAVGVQDTASQSLQAAMKGLTSHWALALAGMACIALGTLVDQRRLIKRKVPVESAPRPATESATLRPSKKTSSQVTPGILIEPVEGDSERKKVSCTCGKRMRVKVESRSVRCPSCKQVLKLK